MPVSMQEACTPTTRCLVQSVGERPSRGTRSAIPSQLRDAQPAQHRQNVHQCLSAFGREHRANALLMARAPKKLVSNSARKATGASGSGKDGHCAMPALLIKRYTSLQLSAAAAICLSPVTSNCNGDTPSKVILDGSRTAAYRAARLGPLLQHPQGRLHLGMPIELGAFHIHNQTVAVLHQRMGHVR